MLPLVPLVLLLLLSRGESVRADAVIITSVDSGLHSPVDRVLIGDCLEQFGQRTDYNDWTCHFRRWYIVNESGSLTRKDLTGKCHDIMLASINKGVDKALACEVTEAYGQAIVGFEKPNSA